MLVEPDLDRRALAAVLSEQYGLAVRRLRFVPAGETAWCYRLTDDRGGRWFLKLSRPGAIERARAEFALELAGALADLGLPVPRPRPTRSGRRWCWLDGLRVTVFELVDGDPLHGRSLADPPRPGGSPGWSRPSTPPPRSWSCRFPSWSGSRWPATTCGSWPWEPPSPAPGPASGSCAIATSSSTTSWWTGAAGAGT